jgi:hypothetical protein
MGSAEELWQILTLIFMVDTNLSSSRNTRMVSSSIVLGNLDVNRLMFWLSFRASSDLGRAILSRRRSLDWIAVIAISTVVMVPMTRINRCRRRRRRSRQEMSNAYKANDQQHLLSQKIDGW